MSLGTYASARVNAGGFVPTDIAGCMLWLDPSDATTVTSNATNLLTWNDKSAAGNDCVIASTSNLVTGSRTINGLNVMDLWNTSGSGSIYAPISGITTDLTVFIVHQRDGDDGQLFDFRSSANDRPLHDDGATGGFNARRRNDTNTLRTGAAASQNTAARVYGYRGTSSDIKGFANGVEFTSQAVSGTLTGLDRFAIGGNGHDLGSGSGRINGAVGEIIVYDTALSVSDRESVDSYLRTKWGTP